jgi:hypothetical protein
LNSNNKAECSSLMTPQLGQGEYEHDIGENTQRVMRAMMGTNPGPGAGFCKHSPWNTAF